MRLAKTVNDVLARLLGASRRLDRYYRDGFDALLRPPIVAATQFLIARFRNDPVLAIAEERLLRDEEAITREITRQMSDFLVQHYTGRIALRAGNTKTHGLLRASFEIDPDLAPELRRGVFASPAAYPAWVRVAGPGPFAPADLDDNGILSLSIKLMGVPGEKLLEDERFTQDFTFISAPTFTTPNIAENVKLQKQIGRGTPVLYFVHPLDSHLLDGVMQGVYARAHANPLQLQYFSCVPYLHGDGQAVQLSVRPRDPRRSRVPKDPGPNYLREAMAETLREREVSFDFLVQLQTDPRRMPVENSRRTMYRSAL